MKRQPRLVWTPSRLLCLQQPAFFPEPTQPAAAMSSSFALPPLSLPPIAAAYPSPAPSQCSSDGSSPASSFSWSSIPRLPESLPESGGSASASPPLSPGPVDGDADRVYRVAAAVSLVERGLADGGRVSVRKAAKLFGLPKSTFHRYLVANRIRVRPRRAAKRAGPPPPKKCGIPFLLSPAP